MAYQPYYQPYQPYPYQPPMMDNLAQLRAGQYQPVQNVQPQPAQTAGQSMVWVNGEAEAMGYLIVPNSAVALWDSSAPVIYLKQADASGKPTMQVFDLVERTSTPKTAPAAPQEPPVRYATQDDLDALVARVDALTAKKQPAKKAETKEDAE